MDFLTGLLHGFGTFFGAKAGEAAGKAQAEKEFYQRQEVEKERQMKWDMFLKEYGLRKEDFEFRKETTQKELELKERGVGIQERLADLEGRKLSLEEGKTLTDLYRNSIEEANKYMESLILSGVPPAEALEAANRYLGDKFRLFEDSTGRQIAIPPQLLENGSKALRNRAALQMLAHSTIEDPQELFESLVGFVGSPEEAQQLLRNMGLDINTFANQNRVRRRLSELELALGEAKLSAAELDNITKQMGLTETVSERINKYIQSDMQWNGLSREERFNRLRQIIAPYRRFLPVEDKELNDYLKGMAMMDNLNVVKVELEKMSIAAQRYAAQLQFEAAKLAADNRHIMAAMEEERGRAGSNAPLLPNGVATLDDYNSLNISFADQNILSGSTLPQTQRERLMRISTDSRRLSTTLYEQYRGQNPQAADFYLDASEGSVVNMFSSLHTAARTGRVGNQPAANWERFLSENRKDLRAGFVAMNAYYLGMGIPPQQAQQLASQQFNSVVGSVFGANRDYANDVLSVPRPRNPQNIPRDVRR